MLDVKFKYKKGVEYIKLLTEDFYSVGMNLIFDNKEYMVIESELLYRNSIFVTQLTVVDKNLFKVEKKFNSEIRGTSLFAKVKKLSSKNNLAIMNVEFEEGLDYSGIKSTNMVDIYYKTFYSKTNTGLFPAPDIDDIVDVEFYSEDENDMKVSWAIKNTNSSRFNDINKRNYVNENVDFKIDKKGMEINSKNLIDFNSKQIEFNTESIHFKSNKNIDVASEGYISIEACKEVEIFGEGIDIKSKKNEINIVSKNDLILKAKSIHNN